MIRAEYERHVARLKFEPRLAFAAACFEHVIPLFEPFDTKPLLDVADAAWRMAEQGRVMALDEQRLLEESLVRVVPNLENDPSIQVELATNLGGVAMELLACAAGTADGARRAALSVLDALTVAIDAVAGDDPGDGDVDHLEGLHPVLRDEWLLQCRMLVEIAEWRDVARIPAWRETHRARGHQLVDRLRSMRTGTAAE